jgi:hypothetical protein
MKTKPAELSANLVAIKGAAAPSPDMPGRAGAPPVAADTTPGVPKAVARSTRSRAAPEPPAREPNLAPLNFRIAPSFRREFRTYAATHDLKLNELLRLSFEAYRRQRGD